MRIAFQLGLESLAIRQASAEPVAQRFLTRLMQGHDIRVVIVVSIGSMIRTDLKLCMIQRRFGFMMN
jgi:hypothetical protein